MPCLLGRCLGVWAAVLLSCLLLSVDTSELILLLLQLSLLLLLLLPSEALLWLAPGRFAEADADVSGCEVTCS